MIHYRNGRIFTAADTEWAQSLLVHDGRLAYVGDTAGADALAPDAEVVDLAGAFVMPGYIDAHTHLISMGDALRQVDLLDAADLATIQQRILAAAQADPAAPRIIGRSWLHGPLGGRLPDRHLIDEVVADRPVYLIANDVHSAWVNTAALAELGIDASTADPIGGTIVRDESGSATGYLLETAALGLMRDFLDTTVTDRERDAALAIAVEQYLASGVTGAVDMSIGADDLATFERALAAGELPIRVAAHWLVSQTDSAAGNLAQVATAVAHRDRLTDPPLQVAGIKIMADGVIDSCTAAMKHPFADGSHPGPIWDLETLIPVVTAADAAGLQIAIHAIGDEASDIALTALEHAVATNGPRDRRHRLEHLETVTEDNVVRLARLGIVASMQPVHSDPAIQETWRASLGDDRIDRGYPWPEFAAAGAVLAFGTDAPTAPHDPFPNTYIATTRRSALDPSLPPNIPSYALPLADTLRHSTRDAAYSCRWEHRTGRLEAGLDADFIVLDHNPFESDLLATAVTRTVVGGVERYRRKAD